ncbi:MAG: precorrin-2 C(20)-methyltransferase, partial [Planctomycetes bacterium]|nr:precorrin-2 C(20)-methyltransferase [Planctomycetota bacterium]
MDSNSFGQFWAVGVGPGDPELLTLKAVNLLRRAHVIYHAGPQAQQGRAWDIVHGFVRPDQESRILLTEPMSVVSASDWRTQYRPGVEQIAADCRQGRDVAYVTEGDPTVYSTASYVWQLLAELAPEIPVEVVPGVSSITAAAARLGWPLAQKKEMFAVVPASYHPADLHEVLKAFPTVCLLKVARTMPQVSQALSEAGGDTEWTIYAPSGKTINLLALGEVGGKLEAAYVENLGTSQEWISRNLAEAADRKSYFSLVLVRRT